MQGLLILTDCSSHYHQATHQTESTVQHQHSTVFNAGDIQHIDYKFGVTRVPQGNINVDNPVCVIHQGSPQFEESARLLKAIDIDALVNTHVRPRMKTTNGLQQDSLRGNIQVSFGIAGGQNVGSPLDPAAIKRHYGATQPRILKYTTEDPNVASALEVGWKIGKVAKIPFCQDGFILQNPQYEGILDFIQETLGHRERWASMTLCCLPLNSTNAMKAHLDKENCPVLSSVLNISWIRLIDEEVHRISLVFCMRKSIYDMLLRERACRENLSVYTRYLEGCATYQLANLNRADGNDADAVKDYYEKGVGSEGFLVSLDSSSKKIVGFAMLSKPSCDKQGLFIGPVAGSILALAKCQKLAMKELVEILFVVGIVNGLYSLLNVLGKMQDGWDREYAASLPGGLVEYIIQEIIKAKGSFNGGLGYRCQPFCTVDLLCGRVREGCETLLSLIKSSWQEFPTTPSEKRARNFVRNAVKLLSHKLPGVGEFSGHHILHTGAFLGLAPYASLNHAMIVIRQNTRKDLNLIPALNSYINNEEEDSDDDDDESLGVPKLHKSNSSLLHTKLAVMLSSATQHLACQYPDLKESMTENIHCESLRTKKVTDQWVPGQGLYRRKDSSTDTWEKITPTWTKGKGLSYIQSDMENVEQFLVEDSEVYTTGSCIWNPFSEMNLEMMDSTISIHSTVVGQERQVMVSRTYLDMHYPKLLQEIRMVIAEHPGQDNSFKDYMKRLNDMPMLMEAINGSQKGKRSKKRNQTPSSESGERSQKRKNKKKRDNRSSKQDTNDPSNSAEPTSSFNSVLPTTRVPALPVPTYSICNGITYRFYPDEDQTAGVLYGPTAECIDKDLLDLTVVNKCWHTLTNDVHAALVKTTEIPNLTRIKLIGANSKESRTGNIYIHAPMIRGQDPVYQAVLEIIPEFPNPDCLVCAAIAGSLGGVKHNPPPAADGGQVAGCWVFGNPTTAFHYTLLCAICTFGGPDNKFYSGLIDRTMRGPGVANEKGQKIVAYGVEGSKSNPLEIGYYLVVNTKEGAPTTLHIAFPQKKGDQIRSGVFCIVRLV
jgi:hypothetical protein